MQEIESLLSNLELEFIHNDQSDDKIKNILQQIDKCLIQIKQEKFVEYGYYKYKIAQKCVDFKENFTQDQIKIYEYEKQNYLSNFKIHKKQLIDSSKNFLTDQQLSNIQNVVKNLSVQQSDANIFKKIKNFIWYLITYFFKKQTKSIDQEKLLRESEKIFGLENFKTLNKRDYSQKEFRSKYKQYLLIEHPDKLTSLSLKKNAIENIYRIERAKQIIYKIRGWN